MPPVHFLRISQHFSDNLIFFSSLKVLSASSPFTSPLDMLPRSCATSLESLTQLTSRWRPSKHMTNPMTPNGSLTGSSLPCSRPSSSSRCTSPKLFPSTGSSSASSSSGAWLRSKTTAASSCTTKSSVRISWNTNQVRWPRTKDALWPRSLEISFVDAPPFCFSRRRCHQQRHRQTQEVGRRHFQEKLSVLAALASPILFVIII